MRLDRTMVLVGGHELQEGTLRWNNCLFVNEQLGLIVDRRLVTSPQTSLQTSDGWRPLADYYRPTGATEVYAGLAIPLKLGAEVIGVMSMDFNRETPCRWLLL